MVPILVTLSRVLLTLLVPTHEPPSRSSTKYDERGPDNFGGLVDQGQGLFLDSSIGYVIRKVPKEPNIA